MCTCNAETLAAALTREKSLKEALELARKQAADSQALAGNRTQEAVLQLDQRNAELAAAHQREAELKRLLEQRVCLLFPVLWIGFRISHGRAGSR